jgi:exodeoxyribonuclease VII small subunit
MSEKKLPEVSTLSYEQARDELHAVVTALESGNTSLDESMAMWERAEALADHCEKQLAGARKKLDDVIAKKAK